VPSTQISEEALSHASEDTGDLYQRLHQLSVHHG
jgi:hypothetical protein